MVSVKVVVWSRAPDIPVTVTVAEPTLAIAEAVRVNVLLPVVLAGLKDAVTPAGRPVTARFTALLKPFRSMTLIVPAPLLP